MRNGTEKNRDRTRRGLVSIESIIYKRYVGFTLKTTFFIPLSRPDKRGYRLKQARFWQRRDENLHINTLSRNDFENKGYSPIMLLKVASEYTRKKLLNVTVESNVKPCH